MLFFGACITCLLLTRSCCWWFVPDLFLRYNKSTVRVLELERCVALWKWCHCCLKAVFSSNAEHHTVSILQDRHSTYEHDEMHEPKKENKVIFFPSCCNAETALCIDVTDARTLFFFGGFWVCCACSPKFLHITKKCWNSSCWPFFFLFHLTSPLQVQAWLNVSVCVITTGQRWHVKGLLQLSGIFIQICVCYHLRAQLMTGCKKWLLGNENIFCVFVWESIQPMRTFSVSFSQLSDNSVSLTISRKCENAVVKACKRVKCSPSVIVSTCHCPVLCPIQSLIKWQCFADCCVTSSIPTEYQTAEFTGNIIYCFKVSWVSDINLLSAILLVDIWQICNKLDYSKWQRWSN